MVILNSLQLLEQLTEIESQISRIEKILKELGVDDQERLLTLIMACQKKLSSGRN